MYPLSVLLSIALLFHNGIDAVALNRGDANLAARAPANTAINVAAVSSKASAYGSSVIVASTLPPYTKPSEAVTQFLAIGDSFTAGVGSNGKPDVILNSFDCRRYKHAYPWQLAYLPGWEEFNGDTLPDLNFGACTGALMKDMTDKQLKLGDGTWRDLEYHDFGRPQLAVLSISGNDIGFVNILNACVFRYSWSPGDCQTTLTDAKTKIASEDFQKQMTETFSKVAVTGRNAAGATPPSAFQVYVTGYIPFWNQNDTGCDDISWGFWGRDVKLTTSLRKQMNDLLTDLNTVIKTVADGLHESLGTIYVDGFQEHYIGHQFCDPAPEAYLKDPVGSQTWFWAYGSGSWGSGSEGPDPALVTSTNGSIVQNSTYSFNLTQAMMEILLPDHINDPIAQHSPWVFNSAFGSDNITEALDQARGLQALHDPANTTLADDLTMRIFHPKGTAYGSQADALLAAIKANRAPVVAGTCHGNQVEGNCTSGSYGDLPDFNGVQSPTCFKADGSKDEIYFRVNETVFTGAASRYCSSLVNNKIVLENGTAGPQPYIVHDAGEQNADLILTVLWDEAACPTDKSNSTLDFSTFTAGACEYNIIYPIATVCEQDSTWADYNQDYTVMGGEFMSSCALWLVQGVQPEMATTALPGGVFSPKNRTGNQTHAAV